MKEDAMKKPKSKPTPETGDPGLSAFPDSDTDAKIGMLLRQLDNQPRSADTDASEEELPDAFEAATNAVRRISDLARLHAGYVFIRGGRILVDHHSLNESANGYSGRVTTFSREFAPGGEGMLTVLHAIATKRFSTGSGIGPLRTATGELFEILANAFDGNSILNDPVIRAGNAFERYFTETVSPGDDTDGPLHRTFRAELLRDCHLRIEDLHLAFRRAEEVAARSANRFAEAIRTWEDRIDAIRHSVPEEELPVVREVFFGTRTYEAYERMIRSWYLKEQYTSDPHGKIRSAEAEIARTDEPATEDPMLQVTIDRLQSDMSGLRKEFSSHARDMTVAYAKSADARTSNQTGACIRRQEREGAAKIMLTARDSGEAMSFESAAVEFSRSIQDTADNFEKLSELGGYDSIRSLATALYKRAGELGLEQFNTRRKGRPKG